MSSDALQVAKNLGIRYNVCIRVIDEPTNAVVSEYIGHNAATNTLLTGIAHFLAGEMLSGQISSVVSQWVPQYISLGTMGLVNQECDDDGLPTGIGLTTTGTEAERFKAYLATCPGYGSDGYDLSKMNNRPYAGLGPMYENRPDPAHTANCELISPSFPRSMITFRDIVPESEAEYPETIDIVYSAMISTGALAQFREPDKDYIFITEAGLWASNAWVGSGDNGLLAGYRICPPDKENWDMDDPENRQILKENIIRVGVNQVAQVIWKIQIGSIEQLTDASGGDGLNWHVYL